MNSRFLPGAVGPGPIALSHPPGIMGTMNDQMALLPEAAGDDEASWELDDHTRHIGKQGLAAARQALEQACARLAA